MQIKLPDKVKLIIDTLNDAGFEAYAVGGCVRDSILGRIPKDWDITTSAKPLEVKKLFRRTIDTGIQHGTVTVMYGSEGYEITTYRIDCEYEDMRHPKEVIFTDRLVEDLKRRDFTINAMAYSDKTGLVDEFDGLSCIEKKEIKAVGKAYDRLTEDALRILRAIRFSAELDYTMDEELRNAIRELSGNLSKISAERICTELVKLLKSDHPEKIKEAYELGITKVILPEFDVCMNTPQNTPHHVYNVGDHTIHTLCEVDKFKSEFDDRENRILKLAMLFHDFGKPEMRTTENGVDHFKRHPEVSEKMAAEIMRRLKLDNDTIDNVKALIKWHDYRPALTYPRVRRLMVGVGVDRMEMFLKVRVADILSQSEYMREEKLNYLKELEDKYRKIVSDGDCLLIKDLKVTGKDLIELGFTPGKVLGDSLKALLDDVIDTPKHNDREYLVDKAKRMLSNL
ncbi:MAG: HD domain-containing protein [Lachnospiraceae bacterium]|nr:HD domain-containing protein [Lachnospiraceae bacterium]